MMKKIILIDGNYWLFSSYYATAAMGNLMTNKEGIPTNAVFGFATRLEAILKQNPDGILIAFDAKGKTFRSELMENYKGTRKETPDELKQQFPIVREFLDAYHIPRLELEGYEGDDIIGTVATMADLEGYDVDIITGDKDMMQLVNEHISVLKRNTKTKGDDVITPAAFFEKYGLEPAQMKDLLGLMGDSADNIPGIKGIGEKTALKLLHEYGSIEAILKNQDQIAGKLGEKIRAGNQDALISKELATILTDLPLDIDLAQLNTWKTSDMETLKDFYRRYDMHSLLKRLEIDLAIKQQVVVEKTDATLEIVTKMPSLSHEFALMVGVYDKNYHKSIILGYGVYDNGHRYYISYEDALSDTQFRQVLQDPSIHKWGYNVKRDMIASRWNGIEINGYNFDLQLASYIINPSLKDDLKLVAESYDNYEMMFEEEVFGKGAKRKIPDDVKPVAQYYSLGAKTIADLKEVVIARLKQEEQYELYENIELPLTFILAEMEFTGVKVDINTLKAQEKEINVRIKALENEIYQLAGMTFNIASPKQLGEVLFEKLQLPGGKKAKTGYSTAADVLEKLIGFHPIIEKILDYRTLTKLNSTYIVGLQDQVFVDGKIHTMYNQALTQTGRLSSTDPNLQNIPIRYEEGKKIRQAFIPQYDYILSFDYSQIELRVVASLANVTGLIDAFNQDVDIHRKTASDIFGVAIEDVTQDMRRQAKAINFGIIYGMSDFGLSQQVGVPLNTARHFIDRYFASYPQIQTFMEEQIKFCQENGYVSTMMNRRRYIPEIQDKKYMQRELGKRLAMNSPIQGSAADLLKVAMIKVDALMKEHGFASKMILQVHDELVFDVKAEELEEMMKIVREGMEQAYPMKVILKAEGSFGKTWYDLK